MTWLSLRGVAEHLDSTERRVAALVRAGRLPPASYHLGVKSPRWASDAIDSAMSPDSASATARGAVNGLVEKIEAEGRARRSGTAR